MHFKKRRSPKLLYIYIYIYIFFLGGEMCPKLAFVDFDKNESLGFSGGRRR